MTMSKAQWHAELRLACTRCVRLTWKAFLCPIKGHLFCKWVQCDGPKNINEILIVRKQCDANGQLASSCATHFFALSVCVLHKVTLHDSVCCRKNGQPKTDLSSTCNSHSHHVWAVYIFLVLYIHSAGASFLHNLYGFSACQCSVSDVGIVAVTVHLFCMPRNIKWHVCLTRAPRM